MRKLVACLACRNEGTRLFGKPLQNLDIKENLTILKYIIDSLKQIKIIDDIVLSISKNKTITASKPKTKTYTQPKSQISSAELNAANNRTRELERKLSGLESKQKKELQRIASDNQEPIINAFIKQDGTNAIISGRVTSNIEVAEVLIDGEVIILKNN